MSAVLRSLVQQIAAEEAKRAHASLDDVLGSGKRQSAKVTRARRRAFRRIIALTGCSRRELARIWGFSRRGVEAAFEVEVGKYDPQTLAQLTWAYGPQRAARIATGRDAAALADIGAWSRLGLRVAA